MTSGRDSLDAEPRVRFLQYLLGSLREAADETTTTMLGTVGYRWFGLGKRIVGLRAVVVNTASKQTPDS